MKKYVSILLALIMMLSLCACGEKAPAKEYEWQEISGGIEITKYLGDSTKVVVPATLGGKLVVSVGTAFSGNVSLEELELPEMVTKADLTNCMGLKRLTAYGDISPIIQGCGTLRELNIPNLERVCLEDIPESVEKLNMANVSTILGLKDKFLPNLTEITISENIKYYGYTYYGFSGRYDLFVAKEYGCSPIVAVKKAKLYCSMVRSDMITVNGVRYRHL